MFLVPENVTAVIVRFSQLLFSNNVKDVTIGSLYSCQQNAIGSYFCWRLHSRFVLTKPLILDFEICLPSSYLWKLLLTRGGVRRFSIIASSHLKRAPNIHFSSKTPHFGPEMPFKYFSDNFGKFQISDFF